MLLLLSPVVAIAGCLCGLRALRSHEEHTFRPYLFLPHLSLGVDVVETVVRERARRL